LYNLLLLDSLLNSGLQSIRVGTDNLLDLLSVLEDHECGHGTDTEFLGNIWDFINVNLDKVSGCVGVGETAAC